MSLDVSFVSGETLLANYNGTCIRYVPTPQEGDGILLDKPLFSWWRGGTRAGTNNYYIAASNVKSVVQNGTSIAMIEPGYALIIDCYFDNGSQWKTFPTGTFTESDSNADHTYYDTNSFAVYFDGSSYTTMHLSSAVIISRDDNNNTRITTTFVDNEGIDHAISFEGDLRVGNGTKMPKQPHLMGDIDFKGFYASGVYEGDVLKNGSGLTEIIMYDEAADNNEPNSYGLNLAIFSTKFLNPKTECRIIPGPYKVSHMGEQGTWMPTSEMTILGMVIPMGTYGAYTPEDDGTQTGFYSYPIDGTIDIQDLGNKYYTISVDLEAQTGYTIKGGIENYNIPLEDRSNDDENDGSSTLTEDLDLDLSHVDVARCFPQDTIYIEGLSTYPKVSEITTVAQPAAPEECGYQFIDIGLADGTYRHDPTGEYNDPGKLVEGDIIRVDLMVHPGDEDKITPGTYTLTPNRYLSSLWPGVCLRGVQLVEHVGTRWFYISSAIGNGYPSYHSDPTYFVQDGWLNVPSVYGYASIYEGTVTITKADGGDNWFTIEIDGQDVLHHKIKGSWTGPIVLGNSDTPVVDSGKKFEVKNTSSTVSGAKATASEQPVNKKGQFPMMRDYVSMSSQSTDQPVPRVTFK